MPKPIEQNNIFCLKISDDVLSSNLYKTPPFNLVRLMQNNNYSEGTKPLSKNLLQKWSNKTIEAKNRGEFKSDLEAVNYHLDGNILDKISSYFNVSELVEYGGKICKKDDIDKMLHFHTTPVDIAHHISVVEQELEEYFLLHTNHNIKQECLAYLSTEFLKKYKDPQALKQIEDRFNKAFESFKADEDLQQLEEDYTKTLKQLKNPAEFQQLKRDYIQAHTELESKQLQVDKVAKKIIKPEAQYSNKSKQVGELQQQQYDELQQQYEEIQQQYDELKQQYDEAYNVSKEAVELREEYTLSKCDKIHKKIIEPELETLEEPANEGWFTWFTSIFTGKDKPTVKDNSEKGKDSKTLEEPANEGWFTWLTSIFTGEETSTVKNNGEAGLAPAGSDSPETEPAE
ncbi:MAG: hypothetical protein DGJ47_000572 [Rickettsiaceae bacterium]